MIISSNEFDFQNRHYYSQMEQKAKSTYECLLDGYIHFRKYILINEVSGQEIGGIHNAILLDYPELFYINDIRGICSHIVKSIVIIPRYRFNESQVKLLNRRILYHAIDILDSTDRQKSLSEKEKAIILHDRLICRYRYGDMNTAYCHEVPGVFLYGMAVCDGVAKAYKYLADRIGLKSYIAVGNALLEKGLDGDMNHAWNVVIIKGQSYHVDVTFDQIDSNMGGVTRKYCLLQDDEISRDHRIILF